MEDSSCSCVNEGLTSERRGFIIAAGGLVYAGESQPIGSVCLLLGEFSSPNPRCPYCSYSIPSAAWFVNLFFIKIFFLFWLDNG